MARATSSSGKDPMRRGAGGDRGTERAEQRPAGQRDPAAPGGGGPRQRHREQRRPERALMVAAIPDHAGEPETSAASSAPTDTVAPRPIPPRTCARSSTRTTRRWRVAVSFIASV